MIKTMIKIIYNQNHMVSEKQKKMYGVFNVGGINKTPLREVGLLVTSRLRLILEGQWE